MCTKPRYWISANPGAVNPVQAYGGVHENSLFYRIFASTSWVMI